MKTVLFIERDIADEKEDLMPSYQVHMRLYEEIGKAFDIDVCPWYSQGQTIEAAVPNLYNILEGVNNWRGIVVSDLSYGRGKHAGEDIVANPFDLYDMPELDDAQFRLSEECVDDPLPIVRLSRMLGGIPKAYRMRSYAQGEEKPYDGAMMRYHLKCPAPKELVFISPRNTSTSVLMFDEDHTRKRDLFVGVDFSYVERNGYADCSRFIVVDRTLPPSTLYNNEMLSFWLFVLSYGMDSEGRSTLDIGQLYKARLELDNDEFIRAEAKRFAQFGVCLDAIDEHVRTYRAERRYVSNAQRQPLPAFQERVADYYQFAKREEESQQGQEEFLPTDKRFYVNQSARVVREPKRFIRRAIEEYREHKAPTMDDVAGYPLNASAQEELSDILSDAELRLASLDETCQLETLRNQKRVEKPEKPVAKYPMMSKGKALGMAAVAFVLMIIAALPIPISMAMKKTAGMSGSVIQLVCILVLAALVSGGLALLVQYYLRRKHGIEISEEVSEDEIVTPVEARISKASERMSDYLTVRNGWAYLVHDVPDTALIGDEERFLAQKYAELNQTIEPMFYNPQLEAWVNDEKRNLPVMDWPHILKDLHSGKYDGLQLHSREAFALFNTEVEGLSRYRVPLKCIRRVDLISISPCIVKEVQ